MITAPRGLQLKSVGIIWRVDGDVDAYAVVRAYMDWMIGYFDVVPGNWGNAEAFFPALVRRSQLKL